MSMESRAEAIKMARALYLEDDALEFLESRDAEGLRAFRESVSDKLFDEHRGGFAKLAKLSGLLPAGIAATLSEKALGATLAGRVAGELPPAKAVAIARKLPTEFLARLTLQLEPRRAEPVVAAMPEDIVIAVTLALLEREEYISMARFIDVLPDKTVSRVMDKVDDDAALLRIGFFAENSDRLDQVVRLLPEARLRDTIDAAAEHDLWTEALGLAGHVKPDLKARLLELLLEQPVERIDSLLRLVHDLGLWPSLLPAWPQLDEAARGKLLECDALTDPDIVKQILRVADEAGDWHSLLPNLADLEGSQVEGLIRASLQANKKTLKSLLTAVRDNDLAESMLTLIARVSDDLQTQLGNICADLLAKKDIEALLAAGQSREGLTAFCRGLE